MMEQEQSGAIILVLAIFYLAIFFIWQFRLWNSFIKNGKRKYIQLVLVFILGVFPFVNILLDLFLVKVVGIEHPFTEKIIKVLLWILLLPITHGK